MSNIWGSVLNTLKIWENPLLIKSVRIRLRPFQALAAGAVTLTITAWIFSMVYLGADPSYDPKLAAQVAFIPMFAIQGFVLIFLGTGSIAHGVASEKERGVLAYQRLTPMPPREKILGDLFGFPIREYLMFAITVPFSIFSIVVGELEFWGVFQLYIAFFSSVFLYHMTGLTAGMVSKRPRVASFLSRSLVVILYLILPQIAHLGFGVFSYLTLLPTLNKLARENFLEGSEGIFYGPQQSFMPFFDLSLDPLLFTLLLQGLLIALFSRVMLRKWRDDRRPALGRVDILVFAILVQVLIVGSLWPVIQEPAFLQSLSGSMNPSSKFSSNFLYLAFVIFFALSGLTSALWIYITTPGRDALRVGFRRAKRRGDRSLQVLEDRASSLWMVVALVGICGVGYWTLLEISAGAPFFDELSLTLWGALLPILLMGAHLLIMQSARARFGGAGFLLTGFFLWASPLLLGLLLWRVLGDWRLGGVVSSASPLASIPFGVIGLFEVDSSAHLNTLMGEKLSFVEIIEQCRFFALVGVGVAGALAAAGVWLQLEQIRELRTEVHEKQTQQKT